jgi:hypothetical protein
MQWKTPIGWHLDAPLHTGVKWTFSPLNRPGQQVDSHSKQWRQFENGWHRIIKDLLSGICRDRIYLVVKGKFIFTVCWHVKVDRKDIYNKLKTPCNS